MRLVITLRFLVLGVGLAAACNNSSTAIPTVRVDGSSTVFPITDALAGQFQKRNPVRVDVRVPVGISGTSGGFQKLCAGEIDIANASRPIDRSEAEQCEKSKVEYIEIPIGYDVSFMHVESTVRKQVDIDVAGMLIVRARRIIRTWLAVDHLQVEVRMSTSEFFQQ